MWIVENRLSRGQTERTNERIETFLDLSTARIRFNLSLLRYAGFYDPDDSLALRLGEEALESSVEFYVSFRFIPFTTSLLFRIGTLGFRTVFRRFPSFFSQAHCRFRRTCESRMIKVISRIKDFASVESKYIIV